MSIFLNNKKILVAGGTGFVGKRVIRKLEERGANYLSTSLSKGTDFRNFEATKEYFDKEKPDFVINCAAFVGGVMFGIKRPGEIFFNNTLMAANLMEAARLSGVERFINPISNCTYPGKATYFKEDEWWDGPMHESVVAYATVRKASWLQGWAYKQQYGFDSIHLILPNMYGPGDHFEEVRSHVLGALIMKFIEAKENNKPEVIVWGTGKPIREWLYIDDGAEALIKALEIKDIIDPVNIGVGEGISIIDLANLIKEAVGFEGRIVMDETKPDGAMCKIMDNERMKKIFSGWQPQIGLKEGIKYTIEDYYKNVLKK